MLLSIRDLSVTFQTRQGPFHALNHIDLDVWRNDTLAIVGESGCGKSVLGYAALRLLDDMATVKGRVKLMGTDVYALDRHDLQRLRGRTISLVPQSPSLAFNPVIKIGEQIREFIEKAGVERGLPARRRALEFLSRVGFSDPTAAYNSYPHRLSGGLCEMALIAMAVSVEPKLLVADEPTKGLDVLSRKKILSVLQAMAVNTAMIMITHDIGAASICERMAVMYAGEIVEEGPTAELLASPLHFYTKGLLNAHPCRGLKPIPAETPDAVRVNTGCRFKNRCEAADPSCEAPPSWRSFNGRWRVRCHHA